MNEEKVNSDLVIPSSKKKLVDDSIFDDEAESDA